MKKRSKIQISGLLRGVFIPVLAVVVLLAFFTGLDGLRGGTEDEDMRQLEESIRRVAAACYAAEGIYPPSVEYMCEHYGLQVDEDRYIVDYTVFASNLMPDFTVLPRDGK